jgi:hypothetical protein
LTGAVRRKFRLGEELVHRKTKSLEELYVKRREKKIKTKMDLHILRKVPDELGRIRVEEQNVSRAS